LLEDVGREHLLDRLGEGRVRRNRSDVKKALDLVAGLHRLSPPSNLEPPFTPKLVRWEHELFFTCFLDEYDPEADREALSRAFDRIGRRFLKQSRVLIHRDLQSTNLMWHRGEPVLIDFQGMRLGPASYDVGSFLADPYVNRGPSEQEDLLDVYNSCAKTPVEVAAYRTGATQRLCQALGAFGRLAALPHMKEFRRHIPAAVHQLTLWADDPVIQDWAIDFSERHRGTFPV
jgi:aminoglycoside/choline kinase family phosphotransferase